MRRAQSLDGGARAPAQRAVRLRPARPRPAGRQRPRRARAPARGRAARRAPRAHRRPRRPARHRGGRRRRAGLPRQGQRRRRRPAAGDPLRRRAPPGRQRPRSGCARPRSWPRRPRAWSAGCCRCRSSTTAALLVGTGYRPGRERTLLGGDFYDLVQTRDGAVHLMIGDVSGHGADEAALGVCLRVAWRTLTLGGADVEHVLPTLQDVLVHERHAEEIFATVSTVDHHAGPHDGDRAQRGPPAAGAARRRRRQDADDRPDGDRAAARRLRRRALARARAGARRRAGACCC